MGSRPLKRLLELGRLLGGDKACIHEIRTPALVSDTLNKKEQPSLVLRLFAWTVRNYTTVGDMSRIL